HAPLGFEFAAVKAGIKASGGLDFGIAGAPLGANAAAMFTRNLVVAAPVTIGKQNLKQTRGRMRAVVVNAGNANCATGPIGYLAAQSVCRQAAQLMQVRPEFIVPSSTGIIGVPLPVEKLVSALPGLIEKKHAGDEGIRDFARAIMTTDKVEKIVSAQFESGTKAVNVLGIAKGSGMIHPNLATMLVYLFTDIEASSRRLRSMLIDICNTTFNRISVDGDTSTNDTVLLMASGQSGVSVESRGIAKEFGKALFDVCASLAQKIVADGEGVKHIVNLTVEGAQDSRAADKIARTIAHSMLVKTAWAGADPNWGRILAAAGRSGVTVDPNAIDVYIGTQQVCRGGGAVKFDETAAHAYMSQPKYDLRVSVGKGRGSARMLTCDLTAEYVRINADYST
ncbi:MAG: bifunctional glutamate N-acetyltransferase/amino-acid acetyltransferase ArgJ, partial [Acidobacteriaceae bacterium]